MYRVETKTLKRSFVGTWGVSGILSEQQLIPFSRDLSGQAQIGEADRLCVMLDC